MAGNLFSLEVNDPAVIDQMDSFLRKGGFLRVLMYNYSLDGVLSSKFFRNLAVRLKNGCHITVQTKEMPNRIEFNGCRQRCNLFVFDVQNYRLETEANWSKGNIGIKNSEIAKTYVEIIEKESQASDVRNLDLSDLFELKK